MRAWRRDRPLARMLIAASSPRPMTCSPSVNGHSRPAWTMTGSEGAGAGVMARASSKVLDQHQVDPSAIRRVNRMRRPSGATVIPGTNPPLIPAVPSSRAAPVSASTR